MVQIKGTLSEIIYHNKENFYTIAICENEEEQFTVVGNLPSVERGRAFTFDGTWQTHPTYGEQFRFTEYKEEMPNSKEGIESFLSSGLLKGIGKKTAAAIVKRFGEETFDIIERSPGRLSEVEGIGEKKAASIAEAFRNHKEFAEITLFFQQFGISPGYAMKLYKVYGADTIEAVKANPYQLVDDIFGIGFKKADKIAEKMGIGKDSEYRIQSGIQYSLWLYVNEGHTFVPQKYFCENTAQMLEVGAEQVYEALVGLAFSGDIQVETLEGRGVVFLAPYYAAEQNVCRCLLKLNNAPMKPISSNVDQLITATEIETGITLSENQKFAVKASLQNGVSVITGGPGTGKTTIINTIMKIFDHSGFTTAIAAPTGRAAKRITETSGYEASTIHRLLEYYYSEGEDTMRFGKNAEDPLVYDAIIIDEASMIDILLMNGLVNAIAPGTRLIVVGDADQLPSVGAGNVLRDMINSEIIYSVKLTEIFRQAKESLIVVNAHKINKGEYPDCNEKDKDFFFLRRSSEKEMLETIKVLCAKRLPDYYQGCDAIKDMQVLTPVRKGLLGSMNLNKELQKILNPPAPDLVEKTFGDRIFREKDKVMQIKNNYQMEWKKLENFTEGQGIFNGDVGYIDTIDLEFNELTVVFDDNRYVKYDFTQLDELELAYAVTVHKSQGSEFPIVIMPVSWFPPMLATRNLLYTAVTRGKRAVILVGSENKMHGMVENNRITERYSGLAVRLKSFLNDSGLGMLP
ncbi:ATP-dependent RecD-like DNA helicase [Sinanaerobacter chloroacetimidivorans]|uniref:ATP-dependent RecD2 DNA helicase n=1 Tax=Sinanaerobacter chloroacetimidivorans TaxID=2818044 RepID=A0A8J7VZV7_9FIRM|nr:ATP-dependent RecD-like DNA helicase [Sinanaerobacter chloroacetimidivorans]MBR0598184.1 ATP-dependent RecD-like DNA helicase [Sinanaerobacter chloroacetimidivorans]